MNAYWGHQRRGHGHPPHMPPGMPGYGAPPPGYGHPGPPPRNSGDRSGKLMLILTLVGTVATVVSVLVAIGVGPFDLSSDNNKDAPPASVAPAVNDKVEEQTLKAYVTQVNKVCSDRQAEVTAKLDDFDRALVDFQQLQTDEALVEVQRALRSASLTYSSQMTQINAVPMVEAPQSDVDDAETWRTNYGQVVGYVAEASAKLDAGDFEGYQTAMEKVAQDSPEWQAVSDAAQKIGVICE